MHTSVHALGLLLTFALSGPSPAPTAVPTTSSASPAPTSFVPLRGQFGPGPKHKVRFEEREFGTLNWLRESGAIEAEEDYGSFIIAIVDEDDFGGREALQISELGFRDDYDLLPLGGFNLDGSRPNEVLDSLEPTEVLGSGFGEPLDPDAGLFVVQFRSPVRDLWSEQLEEIGAGFMQYSPMNAYVLEVAPANVTRLERFAESTPSVQFIDEYHPAFRMTPGIRSAARTSVGQPMPVTIQLIANDNDRSSLDSFRALSESDLRYERVGPYLNLHLVLDPIHFRQLARRSDVFAIEIDGTRKRLDERQGQVLAGNLSGGSPSSTGYLAWLASMGFNSSQFGSFSVNVVDDAMSLTGHPDLNSGRVDFALNPTGQSGAEAGHGFLNAHIVAGLNSSAGAAFNDALGYNYGLGMAPWAHVGSTAIFGPSGSNGSIWEDQAYLLGARISSNSWSFIDGSQNPIPDYDSNSQSYDFIVRDARSGQTGNQEYMVIFAAGNDGSGSNTVSTPSTAKNILTVAAGENDRQTGTDGCAVFNSGADDVRDIIAFSSRGPVNSAGGDGRWKPEVTAPGTHIQAGVPQSNYDGSGVCNQYWPSGQTLYGWSSGTSHSTPAIAGGATLVRQWFLNQAMPAPSPAMNKAVIVNSSDYMTGVGANDTLPSNSQGMGRMNLGRSFDGVGKEFVDQTELLTFSGDSYSMNGNIDDSGSPFRVTLVWTDAPGSTTGAPWVNDLDLVVSIGGNNYLGNRFSGPNSITGGSADFRNNTESVFLPAGQSGPFTVTVSASSIAGNGVPGNADSTDQDFALFIYNVTTGAPVTTAAFIASPLSGIVPLNVNFSDLSSADVTSWSWTFGDGGTSTLENPTHLYTAAGTYDVSLSVIGTLGSDAVTKLGYITVQPPGLSDGSFESQTANSAPALPWEIALGASHIISPSGVSSDSGMPTDGTQWCELAGDDSDNATPPSNPGGVTNPSQGATGISRDFNYPSGQSTIEFDGAFLRNEDPDSTFNDFMTVDVTDGSTTVNLLYLDTFSPTSGVSSKYGYAVTPVQNVSANLATLFPSSTSSTTFTITALVGNLVDDFQPSKGYVDNFRFFGSTPPPVAGFTGMPVSGSTPLIVTFTNSSSGSISTYAWTFGDGATSTSQNPSHNYTVAGTYSVALTVAGPGGNDTLTRTNYITVSEPPPVAAFFAIPSSGVAPKIIPFTNVSSGNITSYAWDFGDGGTSTLESPSYNYTTPGTYTVSLTVAGPGGVDTQTRTNYVTISGPPPVAGFTGTPLTGVAPLNVSFSDSSTGNVATYAWTFGDGGTSTLQNPSYDYVTPGTYSVALTVTGPGGSDTLTRTAYVTVNDPPPVAGFSGTPLTGVAPLNVTFSDSSTGNVATYAWTFGDGGTSTLQNPSYNYVTPGTYSVALTVTGPGGSDTLTRTAYVTVNDPPPVAGFTGTPLIGVAPLNVTFSDSSTGNVATYAWTFGDGGTSTLQNPSYNYVTPGTYSVALTVTGPGGSDTLTRTAYVTVTDPPPVAGFTGTPLTGVAPLNVSFSDSSTGNVATYAWTFGDGGTSTLQNPSYNYVTPGTYSVALTVTGPGGSDTLTRTAYVTVNDPPPVAGFTGTPLTGVAPLNVTFSDSSTGNVATYAWTFGDGGTSTLQNPSYNYVTPGTYSVALTVTGPGGSDTLTRTAYVTVNDPPPVAGFTGTPLTGVAPLNVTFSDSSTGNVATYAWTFGDGGTSTLQNPSYNYVTPGTYSVALTVTGPGGSDTLTRTAYVTVNDPPPVAGFSGTPLIGVAPLNVTFSDSSTGNVATYAWTFGDGGTSTLQNPSYNYVTPGTYSVALTVTGPGGSDTLTRTAYVTVNDPPPVAGFSGTPLTGVAPLNVTFSDSSTGNVATYAWTFGDGGTSTLQNPSYNYVTPGTYSVALTVTGPGGMDTLTQSSYVTVATPVTIGSMAPLSIETLQVGTAETVTITGTGFVPSTTVTVDGVPLTSNFTVVDSTTITLAWPLVSALGAIDVVVSNANGSDTTSMNVVFNATPTVQIDGGDQVVPLSSANGVTWAVASEPLDVFLLFVSPDNIPSVAPGIFELLIGNNSTTIFKLPNLKMNAKGWKRRSSPFSGIAPNTPIYWQGLVFDPIGTMPLPASNLQETIVIN